MPKVSGADFGGVWEMTKDASGNDKRGLCMKILPMGPCLCVICGVMDKESYDKFCCPCVCVPFCPAGGGKYFKLSCDLCAPLMITPLEDGSIDGMMQGIYVKKGTAGSGAPPSNEMER